MNISEELIENFFQDKCNTEEIEEVVKYFNEHPHILAKYMDEEDWSKFSNASRLDSEMTEKMLSVIRKETYYYVEKRFWLRYVAAAAVLFSVIFGVSYLFKTSKVQQNIVQTRVVADKGLPILKSVVNKSKTTEKIFLQDGSSVLLESNSELSYYEPFEHNKRSLYLKGQAIFKVAKDKLKPFTVYSNEIATTALGTKFMVNAFEKLNIITVKLYEGKVVIKHNAKSRDVIEKNYYLFSGDEFSYNRTTKDATVKKYVKSPIVVNKQSSSNEKTDVANWYMFNNQNLSQVFEQLSAIYNVKIVYTLTDINKMNFIGKIDNTDSIENILNDIALLNKLSVKKIGNSYIIKKK